MAENNDYNASKLADLIGRQFARFDRATVHTARGHRGCAGGKRGGGDKVYEYIVIAVDRISGVETKQEFDCGADAAKFYVDRLVNLEGQVGGGAVHYHPHSFYAYCDMGTVDMDTGEGSGG